jgi:hypothetical protein
VSATDVRSTQEIVPVDEPKCSQRPDPGIEYLGFGTINYSVLVTQGEFHPASPPQVFIPRLKDLVQLLEQLRARDRLIAIIRVLILLSLLRH